MPRSRSRNRKTQGSTNITWLLVGVLLLLLIAGLIEFVAAHPWVIFLPFLALVGGVAAWFWRREQRKRLWQLQVEAEQWHQREEEQRRLMFAQNLGNLLSLSPREFELTIGSLFQAYGYRQVRHTGGSGDLAADLHALSPQGEYVVIQCKRYAPGQRIGSPEIQKFLGMVKVHHGAQRGIFVTTSTFTAPAQALAQQHNLELIDGQRLTAMFAQVGGARGYPQLSS